MPILNEEIIRRCRKDDLPLLFDCFRKVYPANPRLTELDYFDWQFKKNPYSSGSGYTFLILWKGDNIKAFLGYVPIDFIHNGKLKKACWTSNWYSLGQGLSGLKIFNFLQAEYELIVIAGMSEATKHIFFRYKVPICDPIPRLVAFTNHEKARALFSIDEVDHFLVERSCDSLNSLPIAGKRAWLNSGADFFNVNRTFELIYPSCSSFCRRPYSFLKWRYFDIPRHEYHFVCGENNQFAIFRIEQIKGYQECVTRIIEWNFCEEYTEDALALIAETARRHNSILIDFFCTYAPVVKEIERYGFVNENKFNTVIANQFRPLNRTDDFRIAVDFSPRKEKRFFDFRQSYFSKGDSDLDRVKL